LYFAFFLPFLVFSLNKYQFTIQSKLIAVDEYGCDFNLYFYNFYTYENLTQQCEYSFENDIFTFSCGELKNYTLGFDCGVGSYGVFFMINVEKNFIYKENHGDQGFHCLKGSQICPIPNKLFLSDYIQDNISYGIPAFWYLYEIVIKKID